MKNKLVIIALLVATTAIGGWSYRRAVAVLVLAEIPRAVALKLVQGLVAVHGMGAVEIDHRNGRYATAVEHLRRDGKSGPPADPNAIAVADIGQRYLGRNAGGSFGTLMGYSVSMGGDVDGDGRADVVAGGYEYSDRFQERGMVLLLRAGQEPIEINGPPQHRAWFGHSVANNGDFDGDGRADVLVGARFANRRAGGAYLFSSRLLDGSVDTLVAAAGAGVYEFGGAGVEAELGFEVYFGGDWDGDGRSEVVLRAHIDGVQSGGVYVVFSSRVKTRRVDLGAGQASVRVATGEDYADLGRTITTIGDLDGDGVEELLLGAQSASSYFLAGTYVPSRFYVVMSRDLARQVDLNGDQIYQVAEMEEGDHLGSCVGRLGDLDGDGVGDFAVGARYARERRGVLYIVSGARLRERAQKGRQVSVDILDPLVLVGQGRGDVLGWSCAEASADLDRDGIGDVVVGARGADGRVAGAGAIYLVAGRKVRAALRAGRRELSLAGAGVLKIGSDRHGAHLGSKRRFSAAGDYDGDGHPDLAVGAPGWHEGGIYAGVVWVVSGVRFEAGF